MLTAIATAFGIGYNVARLGTSLRVQSVLLRHRPQCLSDGYCDTLGRTGFDPGGRNALETRMA